MTLPAHAMHLSSAFLASVSRHACRQAARRPTLHAPAVSLGTWAAPALPLLPGLRRGRMGLATASVAAGKQPPPSVVPVASSEAPGAAIAASSSTFRESRDQVALSERQDAFLLERLPRDWAEEDIHSCLQRAGLDLGEDWRSKLLIMRSRLGRSIGRVLVASAAHVPHVAQACPSGVTYRPMDRNDVEHFVEQCERFVNLSDDLHRLSRPDYFQRIITISEVPESYGRRDIVHVIKERCGVQVEPRDVVFRFKRWGRQSDACFVICPTARDADHCVAQIQELAVPKRAAYGSLFGAAFLWSSRATLFLSHPDLDFVLDSKFWVFTTGWQEDMNVDEFSAVMTQMKFRPLRVVRHPIPSDQSSAFFVELEGMQRTKKAMVRLRRLKWRWRMKQETPFFAYPRRIDVHRACEEKFEDEDSAADSDIDEPIHY